MTKLSYRVMEILSSVVLFTSPNETDNTTDCYLQTPDGFYNWIPYNETEFFDTLSVCLGSTINESGIHVRQYTNARKENIKIEGSTIINPENFTVFLKEIEKTSNNFIEDIKKTKSFVDKLDGIFDEVEKINDSNDEGYKIKIANGVYGKIFESLEGEYKNKNEFSTRIKGNEENSCKKQMEIISRKGVFYSLGLVF